MNLDSEKLKIIDWIANLKDETVIAKIKILKDHSIDADWWDEISEAEKVSIERGLEDVKAGRVIDHSEVKKLYEKWL
jgi:predicted transcriptional regulator